jgi:hypothetical protein
VQDMLRIGAPHSWAETSGTQLKYIGNTTPAQTFSYASFSNN